MSPVRGASASVREIRPRDGSDGLERQRFCPAGDEPHRGGGVDGGRRARLRRTDALGRLILRLISNIVMNIVTNVTKREEGREGFGGCLVFSPRRPVRRTGPLSSQASLFLFHPRSPRYDPRISSRVIR